MIQKHNREQKRQKEQNKKEMENYIKGIHKHGIHKKPPNSFSNPNIVISKEN